MSIITKNHKVGIFAIFIASALMLGTISVSGIDSAFAGGSEHKDKDNHKEKDKNDYKGKSNENKRSNTNGASQSIDQTQVSKQSSECSNTATVAAISALCGNNVGLQLNLNTGSNAIGQK